MKNVGAILIARTSKKLYYGRMHMNVVRFPGLNLTLNIPRVAITIFNIEIYWYAILMVSAMVIAIIMFKKRDGLYKIKRIMQHIYKYVSK